MIPIIVLIVYIVIMKHVFSFDFDVFDSAKNKVWGCYKDGRQEKEFSQTVKSREQSYMEKYRERTTRVDNAHRNI